MSKSDNQLYVNSRIYGIGKTGIHYYIDSLYKNWGELATSFDVTFLQTVSTPQLGFTKWKKSKGLINTVLFDIFYVNSLVKSHKGIFHAPSNVMPFFRKRNFKYIVTIHDLAYLKIKDNDSKLFKHYYSFIVKRSAIRADKIITVSESTKRDLMEEYDISSSKIDVVYPGIDEKFLKPIGDKKIRQKYFLSVTTHPKRKNIYSVIKAFSEIRNETDHNYVIVGLINIQQLSEINELLKELNMKDRVEIFGYASDAELINLYRNASFVIYPSLYEGFGFPVVEAMACKCPVITSNNSSLIEVTPDKTWLVDPESIPDIQNKMLNMLNLSKAERLKLITKNLDFISKFNWINSRSKLLSIYKELVSDSKN